MRGDDTIREAVLWHPDDGRVRCAVCPHECRIAPGGRGICGVRENRDGVLVPLTYGLVSSVAADPIEKKPVFHYRPGAHVLSLGSVGCSMRCGHCQNWQISRSGPDGNASLERLDPARVPDLARDHRCAGVAFTYNEPVIWIEYVLDVARLCHAQGLFTVMVTNGYITPEALDLLGEHIDVWRVDVKGFDDRVYREFCHARSVGPVLAAAERAKHRWGMHVEVVTNIVPTVNDDHETLSGIASWIAEKLGPQTPWHLTRFFPAQEYAHLAPTPRETLLRARELGREAGLHFVFLGNIDEPGGEDTVCPQCGAVAVRRHGYSVEVQALVAGSCATCGQDLAIVEGASGHD